MLFFNWTQFSFSHIPHPIYHIRNAWYELKYFTNIIEIFALDMLNKMMWFMLHGQHPIVVARTSNMSQYCSIKNPSHSFLDRTRTHTRSLSKKKQEKGPLDQFIRTWPEPSRPDWCCSVVGLYFKCFLLIVRPSTTTELINLWCAFCRNAWEIRGKRWNAYTRNMCKCCALTISPLGARRKTTKMKLDGNKNLLCILIYYHWLNGIIDGRMEHKPKTDK